MSQCRPPITFTKSCFVEKSQSLIFQQQEKVHQLRVRCGAVEKSISESIQHLLEVEMKECLCFLLSETHFV